MKAKVKLTLLYCHTTSEWMRLNERGSFSHDCGQTGSILDVNKTHDFIYFRVFLFKLLTTVQLNMKKVQNASLKCQNNH